MALDTRQKRMSAMNLSSPWRGPLVDAPAAGIAQGKRQAAKFLYSGILATTPAFNPVWAANSNIYIGPFPADPSGNSA